MNVNDLISSHLSKTAKVTFKAQRKKSFLKRRKRLISNEGRKHVI